MIAMFEHQMQGNRQQSVLILKYTCWLTYLHKTIIYSYDLHFQMCFLEFFEALIACALIHPGSKYYHVYGKRPKTGASERSLESHPSIVSVHRQEKDATLFSMSNYMSLIWFSQASLQERHAESRASEYPTIVVREVSDLTHETSDEHDKHRSSPIRGLNWRKKIWFLLDRF
jgi:hypothetical protein